MSVRLKVPDSGTEVDIDSIDDIRLSVHNSGMPYLDYGQSGVFTHLMPCPMEDGPHTVNGSIATLAMMALKLELRRPHADGTVIDPVEVVANAIKDGVY
jgi:hypothetical protein